jgi:hypothetical protein
LLQAIGIPERIGRLDVRVGTCGRAWPRWRVPAIRQNHNRTVPKHLEAAKKQSCPECATVKRFQRGYGVDSVVGTCLSSDSRACARDADRFWALWKVQNETITAIAPQEQTEEWKPLKISVKAANLPQWAQRSQQNTPELGGKMGDVES